MNTIEQPQPQISRVEHPLKKSKPMNVNRGARLHRIYEQVYLDSTIPEDYSELDVSLGHNVVGAILTVVARQVTAMPGGGRDELIPVAVRRREDGQEVELLLNLARTRRAGHMSLVLSRAGEREVR